MNHPNTDQLGHIFELEIAADAETLEHLLWHGTSEQSRLALGALHRIGAFDARSLPQLLRSENAAIRYRSLDLIENADFDLLPYLEDDDDLLVEFVCNTIAEHKPTDANVVDALASVARNHDVSICREAAIAALGSLGDEAAIPTILAGLEDRAPVRRRAVIALSPFSGPEVDDALRAATEDRDRQVRQIAEDLLG